jgi:hypothetical protein
MFFAQRRNAVTRPFNLKVGHLGYGEPITYCHDRDRNINRDN